MGQVLVDLGFSLGNQETGELLLEDWGIRDFRRTISYCRTARAFQDIPFSLPYTYQALDNAFPMSKFILTIRNSADEWYKSLTRYHNRFVGKNRLPTAEDLKEVSYRYKGWLWRNQQLVYGINEETLYSESIYTNHYRLHNFQIIDYFRYRPDDLLVLNITDSAAMKKICGFLDIQYSGQVIPHLNKS